MNLNPTPEHLGQDAGDELMQGQDDQQDEQQSAYTYSP